MFQLPDERVCEHVLYLAQNTHISQTRALFRAPRTQSDVELAERRKYRESLIYSTPDELQRVAQYSVPGAVGAPAYNVVPVPEGSISLLAPTERSLDRYPPGTRTNTGYGMYDQPASTSTISPGSVFTQDASSASGPGSCLGTSPNSGIAIESSSHRTNSRPSPINPQQQQQQPHQKPSKPSAVGALSITDVSSASNATTPPSVSLPASPPTTSPSTSVTSPSTSPNELPSSRTVVLASVNGEPSAFATALLNSDGSYVATVPPAHIGGGGGHPKTSAQQQQRPAPPRSSPPQSLAAHSSMISSQSSDSSVEGNYVLEEAAPKLPVAPTQSAPGRPLQPEGAYVNAVIVGGRVQHQQQNQQSLDVPFANAPLQNSAAPVTVKMSTPRSLAASADSSQQNINSGPLHPEVMKIYEMAKGSQSSTLSQNAPLLASLCTDSSLMHISGGNVGTPQGPPLLSWPSEMQPTSTSSIPRAVLAPPVPNAAAGGHYAKHNKPSLRPSPTPVRRPVYSGDGEAARVDLMENDLPSPSGAGSGGGGMRSWQSLGADLNLASTAHESPPDDEPGVAHMQPIQTATSASNLAVRNDVGGEAVPRIPRAAIQAGNNKAQMQFAFTPTTVSPAGVRSPPSAFPVASPRQGALYSGQSTAAGPQFYSRTPQGLASQNPWPPYVAPQALPQNA